MTFYYTVDKAVTEIHFNPSGAETRTIWDTYHQTFNTRYTLVGNKVVHHSDVVEALPVGTAPTTSSFST